jgi:hypothetical protein
MVVDYKIGPRLAFAPVIGWGLFDSVPSVCVGHEGNLVA